jgi:uncharacterized membrane protein (UPF0182 family)
VTFQFPPRRDDDEGDLGPPPPPFRIGGRGRGGGRQRFEFRSFGNYNRWIAVGVILILAFIVLSTLKGIYVDWLWFDGIGYRSVYSKVLGTQAWLFLGGAGIFLVYFGGNAYFAARPVLRNPAPGLDEAEAAGLRRVYLLALIAGSIFLSLLFGASAATHWDVVLVFLNGQSFGVQDPQFGRDIGFYVFDLPALRFAYNWLMFMAVLTVLTAASLYLFRFFLQSEGGERQSRVHLSLLLLVIVVLFIGRYWLDRFDLNFSDAGAVFGATYTDIHARLPFIYVSMALAVVTGVALLATTFGRSVMLPIGSGAVWAFVAVIGGGLYPASVQRFTVQPNELERERVYIERNIEATRTAFGLSAIEERPYPAVAEVSRAEIDGNPETVNNIRLLDVRPLLATYGQIQTFRPLYEFLDVDVDRYDIDGVARQVMVSGRELSPDNLPPDAQSWVNRRLQFTHGYGVVMSPVNEVVQEGLPTFFLQDIPVQGKLDVTRPELYYGEEPDHYVIVKTTAQEFDRPSGETFTQNVFEGEGGASLGSIINRLVFAWEFGDINMLISSSLTSDSRVLFRRNIQQRVETIAPFLTLDKDPYLVVADGRLFWIQDAYTTTGRYPYSQPAPEGYNYIRNSVKVVIDAYNGDTTFYLVDEQDPIIQTYAKIFPDLFTPFDEMPDSLREHIRYPEDLFLAQVNNYRIYHITDPVARYNQEDIWNIPTELFGESSSPIPVDPYYVIMKLPGETEPEFVLIMPLTPARRQNTIAWVAARSDGENYGKLVTFRFPTDTLVFGPQQIESRIDQDPAISAQISLWNQSGSAVIRGNLLMIPIGNSNMFVEPIYLQADQNSLPELKRVVVVNGNRVAMEPSLQQSIAVVFGEAESTLPTGGAVSGAQPTPTPGGATPAATPTAAAGVEATPTATPVPLTGDVADLARQAEAAFQRAQAALQDGDFATYGEEIDLAQALIAQIVALTEEGQ